MQSMTEGGIHLPMLRFTVPLVLGNLFQLTYNAVDSIIVGRFVGKAALAAVGTANPIMNIVIFFVAGICMGASILMSEFFGAQNKERLQREISTTFVAGGLFSVAVSAGGWVLAGPLLRLIRTPQELMPEASGYLRVIFLGLFFTFLYNFYANTLRALGDSKTPLYFLILSSVLNVAADLLFVIRLGLGVMGCAWATVLAQAASCLFCALYIHLRLPLLQLGRRWLVLDKSLLGRTLQYSWASALQQACLYVGKVAVQAIINGLGVDVIAAFNAVNRVDDFAFTPQQNIGHAMTTFLAQNRGAGKRERLQKGFRAGMELEMLYCVCLLGFCLPMAPALMRLFVADDVTVTALGTSYLRVMALAYFLPGITNGVQGYFRGMGRLPVTMWSTLFNMIGRVGATALLAPRFGMYGIASGCIVGWLCMLAFELPVFLRYPPQAELTSS